MNKRGFFKFIIITVIVIFLLVIGTLIYFYNYHVFYSMRTCISSTNITSLPVACNSSITCIDIVNKFSQQIAPNAKTPDFLEKKTQEIITNAVYCQGTCKIKLVYKEDVCKTNDKEIKILFHGKELLESYSFAKENNLSISEIIKLIN